jgi:hypothetical protein
MTLVIGIGVGTQLARSGVLIRSAMPLQPWEMAHCS